MRHEHHRFVPLLALVLLAPGGCAEPETIPAALAPRSSASIAWPERTDPRVRFGRPTPLPRTPGTLRLCTYNVLNLFDPVDDPALSGEFDDAGMITTPERCAALARTIRAIDADVVALEEVESKAALEWFRDTYLDGAGYDHVASFDVGYYRGIENAVLSRLPITDARVWPGLSIEDVDREGPGFAAIPAGAEGDLTFQRSPLMVEVEAADGYRLTLFVVHHKSGRDFAWKREAEALKVLELIRSVDAPDRNIVVLGDFNAAPWDKSVRLYLADDLADTLDHRVVASAPGADPEEARRYVTHESGRVIDYVLLNGAANRELVLGSPHVVGTVAPPPTYDWRTDPEPPDHASDHYPVVVDLVPRDR